MVSYQLNSPELSSFATGVVADVRNDSGHYGHFRQYLETIQFVKQGQKTVTQSQNKYRAVMRSVRSQTGET